MRQTNYTINEYGEIIRGDYFFSAVKGTTPQVLPTNRKVWKIWLLSFLTLGIYGTVVMFAMAKETNIACAEDDKHTRGFWGTIFLTIITLGIYGFVWFYKWANRENKYLCRHRNEGGILSGGGLVALMFVTSVLNVILLDISIIYQDIDIDMDMDTDAAIIVASWTLIALVVYEIRLLWGMFVMSKFVKQHNTVNRIYNLNAFGKKA